MCIDTKFPKSPNSDTEGISQPSTTYLNVHMFEVEVEVTRVAICDWLTVSQKRGLTRPPRPPQSWLIPPPGKKRRITLRSYRASNQIQWLDFSQPLHKRLLPTFNFTHLIRLNEYQVLQSFSRLHFVFLLYSTLTYYHHHLDSLFQTSTYKSPMQTQVTRHKKDTEPQDVGYISQIF